MKKVDLVVIGGSAGGILSATTARMVYGDISIAVIRDTKTVMVPCGIPYIYGTLHSSGKNIIPDTVLADAGIELIIDKVNDINRTEKIVKTESGKEISFAKLIIATGSLPIVPGFIPDIGLENVFPVYKDQNYLDLVLEKIKAAEKVVVIGGGFIGVEFAEQISILGKDVTLIELADSCLSQAFDRKYTDQIETLMKDHGIKILTGSKVQKIVGTDKVEAVEVEGGNIISADLVLLGMGARPNTELAEEAGLKINARGGIAVDHYMRTSDQDVFAVGDCAEKKCFFTGKEATILLASTAAMEAKIAGCNVFKLRQIRANKGTISAFSTQIFDTTFASVGMIEEKARQEGFDILIGEASTMDRHPGCLPGAKKICLKLIFSRCSGVLLGAQVCGGNSCSEIVNILSLAIQKGTTAAELNTFQVATHPLLSASPIAYTVNTAAMKAIASDLANKRF